MADRELLELAAKAAGYSVNLLSEDRSGWYRWDCTPRMSWDPLTDDGDALRLAVKLRIRIGGVDQRAVAFAGALECWELERSDPYAATRRAIVRAAAAIASAKDEAPR